MMGNIDTRLASVCKRMTDQYQHAFADECLDTINNRVASTSIDICESMVRQYQYRNAIDCLRTQPYIGVPGVFIPAPPIPPVVVPVFPEVPRGGVDHRGSRPTVEGDLCWVAEQRRWMNGDNFFSYASQTARNRNTCVEARISRVASSGRLYQRDGSRAAKERGGLSHSETDQVKRQYGLSRCVQLTCAEYN